jgi:hypothetical protein
MPQAQHVAAALGGQTSATIEDRTPYLLHVYFAGPTTKEFEIAAGASQTMQLRPGGYEIAARVSNAAVKPFYGAEQYVSNTQYSFQFYIATRSR